MGEYSDKLTSIISELFQVVLVPSQRMYWPYLIGALVLALFILNRHGSFGKNRRMSLVRLLKHFFHPRVWAAPSAVVDYKLILIKGGLRLWAGSFGLVSATALALWLDGVLTATFGEKTPNSMGYASANVLYMLVLFVSWDFSRYVFHRLFHEVPFLWQLHKVHHSAEVLTPATLYRSHPVEALLFGLRGVVVTGLVMGIFLYYYGAGVRASELMGINVAGFFFSLLGANLRHSHIWFSYGRWLERILISPAQHQIHHARQVEFYGKNYGTWLAIWDWLGGSLVIASKKRNFNFGLEPSQLNHNPHSVLSMLIQPLLAALQDLLQIAVGLCRRLGARGAPLLTGPAKGPAAGLFIVATLLNAAAPNNPNAAGTQGQNQAGQQQGQEGQTGELTIDLDDEDEDDPDLTLDTITILGQSRVAGSAHAIDSATLDRFENDDVERVLKQVPGVYLRGEDGYGLRPNIGMRGANSDRSAKITLMEDGVLLAPAPYAAPAAYYFPMMARIDGVEVFKGPASIRFGPNTIGGAINLRTRAMPETWAGYADLGGGTEATVRGHGHGGYSGENFGVQVEGVHLSTAGFKELDGGGDTGFAKNEATARMRWQSAKRLFDFHQVDLRLGYSNEESNETYLGLSDDDFDRNPYRRYAASQLAKMDWYRTAIRADYIWNYSRKFDVMFNAYRHDLSRDWRKLNSFRGGPDIRDILNNPDSGQTAVLYSILAGDENTSNSDQNLLIGTNSRTYVSQGVQSVLHWRPELGPLSNEIELGLRFHNDSIDRNHTEKDYLMQSGDLVNAGLDRETTTLNRGEANALAAHLHDVIEFNRLLVAPGVRMEHVATNFKNKQTGQTIDNQNTVFLPGVGLHYQAVTWLGLLAGVHKGFSPVSPGQPNEVKPEESINYESGLRVRTGKTHIEAIGYLNDYSNLTGECTFSSGCDENDLNRQFNGGGVYVYGLESLASQEFPFVFGTSLTIQAMYTLTLSKFESDFTSANPQFGDVKAGDQLPYVPIHQGTGMLAIQSAGFSFDVSASYVGDMRDSAGQGSIPDQEKIPAHVVVDAAVSYQIIKNGTLYSTVKNLLNAEYVSSRRPFGARPGRPFQVMFGFKYLLQGNGPEPSAQTEARTTDGKENKGEKEETNANR